jgi:hypothetical protein
VPPNRNGATDFFRTRIEAPVYDESFRQEVEGIFFIQIQAIFPNDNQVAQQAAGADR